MRLEKAYNYIKELEEKNRNLILATTPQAQGNYQDLTKALTRNANKIVLSFAVKEIKGLYDRINHLETQNSHYFGLLKQAGINPTPVQSGELWNSKPTKYSNKSNPLDLNQNLIESALTAPASNKKKSAKKSTNKNNQQNNQSTNPPMIMMNDQNPQFQLINQNAQLQDNGNNGDPSQPPINLLNSQTAQLQLRPPAANYQLLPNGQLCSDPMTNPMSNATGNLMPGQIIISSQPFLNQPTSAIMLPNGQILSVVQNQPNQLILNPNSGLMLANPIMNSGQPSASGNHQTTTQNTLTQASSLIQPTAGLQLQAGNPPQSTSNAGLKPTFGLTSPSISAINSAALPNSATKGPFTQSDTDPGQPASMGKQTKSKKANQNTNQNAKTKAKKTSSPKEKVDKPVKASKIKKSKKSEPKSKPLLNSDILAKVIFSEKTIFSFKYRFLNFSKLKPFSLQATESIFDFEKMDDMGDFTSEPPQVNQSSALKNDNDTINDAISSVINSSTSEVESALAEVGPQEKPEQDSINETTKNELPSKKRKLTNSSEIIPGILQHSGELSQLNAGQLAANRADNQVNEIDKLLNTSDVNFDFNDGNHQLSGSDLIKTNNPDPFSADAEQNTERDFLSSLNSDPLSDFLISNTSSTERPKNDDKNGGVEDLFGQISHSISSITENDKDHKKSAEAKEKNDSLNYLGDPFQLNMLGQEPDKASNQPTSQPSSLSISSLLSYSAEALITKPNQPSGGTAEHFLMDEPAFLLKDNQLKNSTTASSQQPQSKTTISYSAERLIHSSSSSGLREEPNKKQNYSQQPQLVHQQACETLFHSNDQVSNLSQPSPVSSHHSSSSRPPSNHPILSPHQTSHQLNRSLNSPHSSLNNSMNNGINKDPNSFMHNSENERNSSLFSSSANSAPTIASTISSNQARHNTFNSHSSFNAPANPLSGLLSADSSVTTASLMTSQSSSSFFNQMSATNNYSSLSEPNPSILPFNYKDPLNQQTAYKASQSLITNTGPLFPDSLNSSSLNSNPSQIDHSLRKPSVSAKRNSNLSPNSNNKQPVGNKKSSSSKLLNQSVQSVHQNAQTTQHVFTDYASSAQNATNRQSQFYFDTALSANNNLVNSASLSTGSLSSAPLSGNTTRTTDFINYLPMPDFGNSSNARTNDPMNKSNVPTSSGSVFSSNQLANDNCFLRPQSATAPSFGHTASSFNLNLSSSSSSSSAVSSLAANQLAANALQNQTTNRPNFNLSNIIPDISNSLEPEAFGRGGSLNGASAKNSSLANPPHHSYFTTAPDQTNVQFGPSMHSSSFNNHLHLTPFNTLNSSSASNRLSNTLNGSSLNSSLHSQSPARQGAHLNQSNDAANLYRSFGNNTSAPLASQPFAGLTADSLTGNLNSGLAINSSQAAMNMGAGSANLATLNGQSNANNTLISSQNVTNQNSYSSYNVLPFI